ncbi:regulatory protein RecX [Trujillonella endophytica]|uniref:Regulatory protein RecX n=1 Tax=Trujillonella endophytica TaxID=673521 RepID=A0A1H8VGZ7_9ACTN|nr:regulatory protein RecX [Trujillella endophytica]SEP14681.1 regulatory protein [Trujillella endophytica]
MGNRLGGGGFGPPRGRRRAAASPEGGAAGPADDASSEAAAALDDPEAAARDICLRALTGTAKTRRQLEELLARKEIPDDAAAAVLDRFGEVGLIDDAAFARAWVDSRQASRGLSRRALKSELRAKGVDCEDADQALALVGDQDEWDAARRLVARRVSGLRRVDRETAHRRLLGMLARKGYGSGLAGIVVREALDAEWEADEPSAADTDQGLDAFLP